jgi:broad specificity phosphatase PhoE
VADPARLTGIEGSLAFVRHGESTWIAEGRFQGQANPPLSELGRQQAAGVAQLMAPPRPGFLPLPAAPPLGIWCSPLARAAETAQLVARAQGPDVPVEVDPGLAELAQGDWEGLFQTEVRERYPDELAAWRRDPVHHQAPGGEPLLAADERAAAALGRILSALPVRSRPAPESVGAPGPAEPVLGYGRRQAGAAGQPVDWAIVVAHDGILRLLMMRLLGIPPDRYWAFPFGLCSVTVIELRDGMARLRAHNLGAART